MKRTILAIVLAVLFATTLYAGEAQSETETQPSQCMRKARHKVAEALDLTDEQKAEIKEIISDAREQAKQAESREEKREILKSARKKIRENVFTDEQREKLTQLRRQHSKRKVNRHLEELGLSEEQKDQARQIMSEAREQAGQAGSRKEKREILLAARKKVHDEVFSDEQQEKARKLRHEHMKKRAGRHMNRLGFSDEQKAQARQIMSEAREQAKQAKTPEEKRTLFREAKEKVRQEVMTDEQREKVERHRRARKHKHHGPADE